MRRSACFVAALSVLAACGGARDRRELATSGTLTLVRERNLSELLDAKGGFEASGVALRDGSLRVVFDNSTRVADVSLALDRATLGPGKSSPSQYEGISIATRPAPNTYVVKEIGAAGHGAVVTLDDKGAVVATESTDIAFTSDKGLEGIAWLDDIERLLVLCEERSCGANAASGAGMMKALRHEGSSWVTETTLTLPSIADFEDFSDLAVLPEADGTYRIAVVSQDSAALWLGTLTTKPLAIDDPGVVYGFPRAAGSVQYCSVEGITFIDRTTIAMASDRPKGNPGNCNKAEALHVFALP
jgi:hypothetical protein